MTAEMTHRESALSALWTLVLPGGFVAAMLIVWAVFPQAYHDWFIQEIGVIELSQALVLAFACFFALRCLSAALRRGDGLRKLLVGWSLLAFLCCLYVLGEELSWGQQIFRWATPEGWGAVNDQDETNLHNVSSWFDQKPRLLLELGVIIGGLILPQVLKRRTDLQRPLFLLIVPPASFAVMALLALALRLPEALDLAPAGRGVLFERPSEVQESIFFFFVLFYLVVLSRRLKTGP